MDEWDGDQKYFLPFLLLPPRHMENNGGLLDSRAKVGKRGRGAAGDGKSLHHLSARNKLYNITTKMGPAASN